MPALSKQRHFEILLAVLALAEERGTVQLDEAAEIAGISDERLRELLEPILYLEFRTGTRDIVSEAREFLLTEDGSLMVANDHWLRDLVTEPPDPETALRLLVAGLAVQSVVSGRTPDLDRALTKLRAVVDARLRIQVEAPPCLAVAQEAWHEGRSLRFRYISDASDAATDREALPYRVYCKWGHWYFQGRAMTDEEPKHFRIDRMVTADLGDVPFDPPPDAAIPDWFDLSGQERTVTLRLTATQLEGLPRPHTTAARTSADGDGRVEVDVTVAGERRLEHLLVTLDPSAEVIAPPECAALQRAYAARLLAVMT